MEGLGEFYAGLNRPPGVTVPSGHGAPYAHRVSFPFGHVDPDDVGRSPRSDIGPSAAVFLQQLTLLTGPADGHAQGGVAVDREQCVCSVGGLSQDQVAEEMENDASRAYHPDVVGRPSPHLEH